MYFIDSFKKYNYQIRGFAVLSVILIHVLSATSNRYIPGIKMFSVYTLDGLLKFAVPLFLISSVFFLFSKFEISRDGYYYKHLIKKVTTNILPIYIISSVFYFYFFNYLSGIDRGLDILISHTIFNRAAYHLWYLYLIIGVYLFFPLIRKIMFKLGRNRVYSSAIIQLISVIMLPFILKFLNIKEYPEIIVSSFFLFFIFYIAIGSQLYLSKDFIVNKKHILATTIVLAASVVVHAIVRRFSLILPPEMYNTAVVCGVLLCIMSMIITISCLLCVTYIIYKIPRGNMLDSYLLFCGKNSLSIYIIHVLFVEYIFSFLNKYQVPVNNLMYYLINIVLSTIGSVFLAWLFLVIKNQIVLFKTKQI